MKSVGVAALAMVEEVRRQFREMPGILEGTTKPDYKRCVEISTAASLNEMLAPGALVLFTPLITGILFGTKTLVRPLVARLHPVAFRVVRLEGAHTRGMVSRQAGVLAGSLVSGVQIAISASNTGGAWDNAKKYLEAGNTEQV
jgi:Na+/H+-translocating membrane pyrophosphatase